MSESKKTIIVTIDLEDWFQVENFKDQIPYSKWNHKEWRYENSTNTLLELFDHHGIKVTFFILGWNAEKKPNLIKKISQFGHEVASHGYYHQLCGNLGQEKLSNDLEISKKILEDLTGKAVFGYRAPSFSVNSDVINLLKKTTYLYDSSYNNFVVNNRYGELDLTLYDKKKGYFVDQDKFVELPISNLKIGGQIFPWGGGGYFRLYPNMLFRWGVSAFLAKEQCYVFYLHPWEIDFAQPLVPTASLFSVFRHYYNQNSCLNKLSLFLDAFKEHDFRTCADFLQSSGDKE